MASVALNISSSGARVSNLQSVLNHVLPLNPLLAPDSIFGQKTKERVIAF